MTREGQLAYRPQVAEVIDFAGARAAHTAARMLHELRCGQISCAALLAALIAPFNVAPTGFSADPPAAVATQDAAN